MATWAVVIVDGNAQLLARVIAGVPLWKRLVFTLQEAGLSHFLFLGDLAADDLSRMRDDLASDPRFKGEAYWLRREEAEGRELPAGLVSSRLLLVSAEALLNPLLIRRFLTSAVTEDPEGSQKFALVDARRPFPCPSMAEVNVTQCYWRKGSPVAFCPSHVFHPVEFAGAFICPSIFIDALLDGWRSSGWVGLMGALGDRLEAGCKGYLITGRQVLWPGGDRERSTARADLAVVSQLRVYRTGRLEGVLLGRLSGWLALALSRIRAAAALLAVLSVFSAIVASVLMVSPAYLSDLAGTAVVILAVILKLALEDLGHLRFEEGRNIARLAAVADGAAKSLPLIGIAVRLTVDAKSASPAVACALAIAAYFLSTAWPTPKAARWLRQLRGHLRGHGFLYLLAATSLVGRSAWFLWISLVMSWLVGGLSWLQRRRAHPLTRLRRLI